MFYATQLTKDGKPANFSIGAEGATEEQARIATKLSTGWKNFIIHTTPNAPGRP